ncbi:DUF1648 domain-containing protein [Clostridium baratii]|uniref:DUF1648 domain-containing protein n=1 Tax=Clostridium baratii TaxID=1561 RepID=UPI0005F2807F|nr:DUF1648 domain-containing protein [Clostridium baratii]KJU72573.1 hypothetical protein UC77_00915 [Clostridium baratii]
MDLKNLILFYEFIIITIFVLFIGMALNINNLNYAGVIYGIRVPNKYRKDIKIKKIDKEYKKKSVIYILILTIIFSVLIFKFQKVFISILYIFIMVFLQFYLYSKANKEMKKVKEEIGWKKEFENKKYIEIKNLDKKDYDNKINMKWFIIAFLIAILSLIITIVKLKSLPDLVPVHFNFNGDVDRYADIRTLGGKIEIFLIPIMSMSIIFIMYISTFIEYKKRKNIKLNGGTYEQIREIENTTFKSINDMMSGISIFIAILMLCITFTMTGIIKSNKLGLNITMIITAIMVIYIIIYTIYLMIQNKNINKDYNSKSPEYYIDDDDEFKWGIFYYNPKDKSILSRKRMGIGYDFNYGNEKAIIIVVILDFILISSLVMTIIMGV